MLETMGSGFFIVQNIVNLSTLQINGLEITAFFLFKQNIDGLRIYFDSCRKLGIFGVNFISKRIMQDFVHLHVHTQYSILDGQASIPRLVDKAIADGMKGIAITDHGDMFGIKEFFNYVNKKNGGTNGEIKDLKKKIAAIKNGKQESENPEADIAACQEQMEAAQKKLFKPIIGCEMYVARNRLTDRNGKTDQSGYHLVVLAKNLKGYHNLIKLVSKAWTQGFYMRPRTDRVELENTTKDLSSARLAWAGKCPGALPQDNSPKRKKQSSGIKTCSATITIWSFNAIRLL